ncbi:MFS transporter [Streptomyces sp. NPDC102451]|uniref:MFS transporter n=1 Tax=Streptomyces sp. NPDC102451 TaxID=3366177 RepID=UPI003823F460
MSTKRKSGSLPFAVHLLGIGAFLMGTTEFIIAGILPELAADLGVGVARAGLLITAFAIGMIVGAPAMGLATLRLPRRSTLVLTLAVFAAGHVIAALSSSFTLVFAARVLSALATGAFWAVASVVATAAAGPAMSSRALGVMVSGSALATVIGVPVGTWAGQAVGWRGTFWALAALAGVAALLIGRFVPADEQRTTVSVRSEFTAVRQGRLWLSMSATALITGGAMAAFSYITPLLTERTGLSAGAVPLVLIGYGIGALAGTNLGGRLGDRKPLTTVTGAAIGAALILLLLIPLSHHAVPTIVLVVLLGAAGMSVPPVVTSLRPRDCGRPRSGHRARERRQPGGALNGPGRRRERLGLTRPLGGSLESGPEPEIQRCFVGSAGHPRSSGSRENRTRSARAPHTKPAFRKLPSRWKPALRATAWDAVFSAAARSSIRWKRWSVRSQCASVRVASAAMP